MADVISRGAKLVFDDSPTRDYNHATDNEYKRLRDEADRLYKKRNQLSQQSQNAYKSGDKQKAHELSEESKKLLNQAEDANMKAAQYVFRENNADSAEDEIDLHGLYVKEAEYILQTRISNCIRTNQSHLKVIVGKGLHSANGIAKLKPAIDQMCDESNLKHRIDPHNSGVLIIDFTGSLTSQIPNHWNSTISQPQQAYHGTNHPQYQQSNQHSNQNYNQQSNNFDSGNGLINLLIKGICMCLNSK